MERREEKYIVKNLQYSESAKEHSEYIAADTRDKYTADTIGTYIDNANAYIERRGIFMAGMLRIAFEFEDTEYSGEYEKLWEKWKVSGIYKCIADRVLLQDKSYSGYGEVIEKRYVLINSKI